MRYSIVIIRIITIAQILLRTFSFYGSISITRYSYIDDYLIKSSRSITQNKNNQLNDIYHGNHGNGNTGVNGNDDNKGNHGNGREKNRISHALHAVRSLRETADVIKESVLLSDIVGHYVKDVQPKGN